MLEPQPLTSSVPRRSQTNRHVAIPIVTIGLVVLANALADEPQPFGTPRRKPANTRCRMNEDGRCGLNVGCMIRVATVVVHVA